MTNRTCGACGLSKPLAAFNRMASDPLGRQRRCRDCANRSRRGYGERHSDALAEAARKWRRENPDKARASVESWRSRNRERYEQSKREWELLNHAQRLERYREWRASRRQEVAEALRAWKAENRERVSGYHRKRRATVRGATVGELNLSVLWDEQAGRCAICDSDLDRDLAWPHPQSPSLDHILPLSKGGSHSQENVRWTCLVCNLRKGDRLDAPPTA